MKEDAAIEYKSKTVVIKALPSSSDNLSVFVRPGDEVNFAIQNFDVNALKYQLIGGDIVVVFPNGGVLTFASMALMGYSQVPPILNFGGAGKRLSIDEVLSKIDEVNELPIESVNASFIIKVSDTDEQVNDTNAVPQKPQVLLIISDQTSRYDQNFDQDQRNTEEQIFTSNQENSSASASLQRPQVQQSFTGNFSVPGSDFDAYAPKKEMIPKPDEEMIPKPDEEMIPKPDEEMIPKPDEEMIPKPDEEMIPDNDFISDEEGFGDGWGDSYDDGNGDGAVDDAAKPAFYFKATAHQVRYSEIINDTGDTEVLGGGGSINGYKFDSVTNQFEPETIDMSSRSEDMIIRAENSTYFSNMPPSQTEIHTLTFQDLIADQSVTVDGLTLTATGDITALDVAAAFADLAAASNGSTKSDGITPNSVVNGTFTGALSANWSSGLATSNNVIFTSTEKNSNVDDIVVSSAGLGGVEAPLEVVSVSGQEIVSGYLSRVLRFEPQMPEGFYVDNFILEGLPTGVVLFDKDGNTISGSTITKDQILFKDSLGNVIDPSDTDFLTSFKTAEFVIKYVDTLESPFNVSITGNYKLDETYLETTDIAPEQSFTNEYTFALKDITAADDYTYNQADFANAKAEGFILAKETNYNIIKDGSGNSFIYGGAVKDVVYDGAGDDTYYLNAGDDTLYAGSGTNFIYGDTKDANSTIKYEGVDSVSYENVQSFKSSEVKLLRQEGFISTEENQKLSGTYVSTEVDDAGNPIATPLNIEMLAAYKGIYIDLDGVYVDGLDIDVDGNGVIDADDKINSISKFANRVDKFVYDESGNAIETTIGKSISFVSTLPNAAVEDISTSSVGVLEVAAPDALSVVVVSGGVGVTETHTVTFDSLIAGQSITIDGLTLTATGDISAEDVAAAFANLAASAGGNAIADGTWSGNLSVDWYSGDVNGLEVTFTSITPESDVADIIISYDGVDPIVAPENVDVTAIQGNDVTTEKYNVVFKDLIAGQSVTVGGLTLTATAALSATEIAAGFANLLAGSTSGNAVAAGEWSGSLSDGWSSGEQEQIGLENLQAIGYDILADVENITGSNYNDTMYGNSDKDNVLSGLGGSDTLDGRGGDNTLLGGDGYDTLYAGTGKDFIDGGADTDIVSYANMTEGMIIRFDRPNAEDFDYAGYANGDFAIKDKIINAEDIRGSNFADTIYGNGSTNFIEGLGGDDRIFAGGGYDFIDGGAGSDWISYLPTDYPSIGNNPNFMEEIQGITVDLNSADFVMVKETTTSRLLDLVKSIEQISATNGNDVIYGGGSAETFWGHDGDDRLESRGGNDTLYGGDGDDYIRPGRGVDYADGGDGIDYLELYDDALLDKTQQTLRLNETGVLEYSTDTTNGSDGNWTPGYKTTDGVEQAINFEGIGLSNGQNIFYGNNENNIINSHNGDDIVYGLGGDDTINGGNNNDILYGDDVSNTLSGNDTLIGGNGNDIMYGGKGDDLFHGSIRVDTGSDADEYHGGEGIDTLDYSKTNHNYAMNAVFSGLVGDGEVTFSGTASNATNYKDTFTSIERFIGSRGNDTINASATNIDMYLDGWSGTDTITGGDGDDTIVARATNGENLNGGLGKDMLLLAQSVQFTAGNANVTNNITVAGFEVLDFGVSNNYYTRFNVTQWGNNAFEDIIGGANNRLFLHGSNNDDAFNFGTSSAPQDFSSFSGGVYLYGYNGNDTFDFTNTVLGSNAVFYIDGGSGTDTLKLGENQTLSMTDNYYNTLEDFDLGADTTLNITALTNSGRTFNAHNKNFDGIDADDAKINFIGGSGNDIFYLDFSALRDEKFAVEGGLGSDRAEIRNFSGAADFSDSKYIDLFANIEILDIDQGGANEITFSAENLASWIGDNNSLTLDIANNTQGASIKINTHDGGLLTDLTLNSTYTVQVTADESFVLNVV